MANNYSKLTDKVNGRKIQVDSAVRDGNGNKIDTHYILSDGYYPQLGAGYADIADNLTPYGQNSGAEETNAFVMQTSGGNSDVGSYALIKELQGNTVAFNQLAYNGNFANNVGWSSNSGADSFSTISIANNVLTQSYTSTPDAYYKSGIITSSAQRFRTYKDHYYLIKFRFKSSQTLKVRGYTKATEYYDYLSADANEWYEYSAIKQATSNQTSDYVLISVEDATILGNGDTLEFSNIQLFDLTLMFGVGNEPTTALEFIRLFPSAYYEYNLGQLFSSKSAKYKVVGYNALVTQPTYSTLIATFNANTFTKLIAGREYTLEFGSITNATSYRWCLSFYDVNGNIIKDIKSFTFGSAHYFNQYGLCLSSSNIATSVKTLSITPHKDCYVLVNFGLGNTGETTSMQDVCLHLTWDGEKTGYEQHSSQEYTLPNVELKRAGDAVDSITPNGTLTRKIGQIDLGTLTYTYYAADTTHPYGYFVLSGGDLSLRVANNNNIKSSRYITDNVLAFTKDRNIFSTDTKSIYVIDSEFNDGDLLKIALNGSILYVELEEPQVSSVSSFIENTEINDWGTQEFVNTDSPIPSVIVPQGNKIFYAADYKAFIDSLGGREDIKYDASKIVSHAELTQALNNIPTPDISTLIDPTIKSSENSSYGLVTPDTSSFTADKEIATTDQAFNVINATDIANNTLTQAQYDLITNGKPTLIKGTILGYTNPLIVSLEDFTSTLRGFMFTGRTLRGVMTTVSTRQISDSGNDLRFDKVNMVNGKVIPAYPTTNTSPQVLTIGANGGNLSYSDPFNPTSVSISDGGTISDTTLQANIQYHRPIVLNGFTCYFSCDDGTNYQYVSTRYDSSANKNHINVITINKSTFVATFHTSDLALS